MNYNEKHEKDLLRVSKKVGLTVEGIKRLTQLMNSVWNYIGDDLLSLVGGKSISRSTVIEVVTDAGRMEVEARNVRRPEAERVKLHALVLAYYSMDGKQRKEIDKLAFPFPRYGC